MSFIGYVFNLSGWLLVVAALVLLPGSGQRLIFVVAGLAVEMLGIALLARHYRAVQKGAR